MFAAVFMLFAKWRITAVLLNGVLGYSISFFFVIFRAPDLALTQLVVESVTTALFLLCFKYLPDLMPENSRKSCEMVKCDNFYFCWGNRDINRLSGRALRQV